MLYRLLDWISRREYISEIDHFTVSPLFWIQTNPIHFQTSPDLLFRKVIFKWLTYSIKCKQDDGWKCLCISSTTTTSLTVEWMSAWRGCEQSHRLVCLWLMMALHHVLQHSKNQFIWSNIRFLYLWTEDSRPLFVPANFKPWLSHIFLTVPAGDGKRLKQSCAVTLQKGKQSWCKPCLPCLS